METIDVQGARLARLWILLAVCYLIVGVVFGIVMGATEKLQYAPVHAHINLLGWTTMALTGLIYARYPAAGGNRLGVVHFWSFQILFPILIAGLFFMFAGHPEMVPVMIVGSLGILVSLLVFAVNLFQNMKRD